jgi:ribosomal protein S18 acetylase RimI-like enzyme
VTAIRRARPEDWPALWKIIEPVFRAGETYAVSVDIEEDEARALWLDKPLATFVAVNAADGRVLGSYFLKFNQPGGGNHVCNCGYIVARDARGRGVAGQLCEHSQREAIAVGFRAMQYNLVVATNTGAIRLWQRHGFDIVGRLPGAFRHPTQGEVDALVMYKRLVEAAAKA